MSRLDSIKEKASSVKTYLTSSSTRFSWPLKITVNAPHSFEKTIKQIDGSITLHAKQDIKIKKITYEIIEQVDPIIGKNKEEAETLWQTQSKRWFKLSADDDKELSFAITIKFANEHRKKRTWWDMTLLNQMSERSKKTAVNYTLHIKITYTTDDSPDLQTKEVKHEVGFE